MAERRDRPWPEALEILRVTREWSQLDLARAVGVSPRVISKYESGERVPESNAIRLRLIAVMGFPAHALERTCSFIESARAARDHELAAAAGALEANVDGFVSEAGIWMEELVRDVLVSALREAPSLARGNPVPPSRVEVTSVEVLRLDEPALPAPGRQGIPPLGKALTILRIIRGWGRDDLARAAAISGEALTRYERARTKPDLTVLERLLEALGFPAAVFERCVTFVEWACESRRLHLGTGDDKLRAQAGEIAARHARQAEEYARLRLGEITIAARLLMSRSLAPAAWAVLAGCSDRARQGLVQEVAEFQTAGLCELVCDESRKAASDSAERARRLAELAVEIAEHVGGPEGWRSRLLGYARFHLANTLRVNGNDLPAAADALEHARELWDAGAADDPGLLNAARVMSLEASLRRAQRRVPEALELLDQALAIDRWGETPSLLLGKARALFDREDYAASIGVLEGAVGQIDVEREPRQGCVALDLLLHNLCLLGRHAEAAARLAELRALGRKTGNRLDLLRVAWLGGKIAAGTGRPEEAVATLEQVREEFVKLKSSYDVALVTVELAEILAGLGRHAAVRALALESVPIFRDQGLHAGAQHALEVFCRSAAEDRTNSAQLRGLLAYLYRARNNPQLRFDAAA